MSRKVKGMVQLAGITYRIVRVASGSYTVVRISDDRDVGRFSLAPALSIEAIDIDPNELREVARLAIHTAKTSYVGFPRPQQLAGLQEVVQAVQAAQAARRPSSMPPAIPPNR